MHNYAEQFLRTGLVANAPNSRFARTSKLAQGNFLEGKKHPIVKQIEYARAALADNICSG